MFSRFTFRAFILIAICSAFCTSILSLPAAAQAPAPPEKSKDYRSGWLGIVLNMKPDVRRPPGAQVVHVFAGSPADRAGLRGGDLVVALNGSEVTSAEQLAEELRSLKANTNVELSVERGGQLWGVSAVLSDRMLLHPARARRALLEPDQWQQVSEHSATGQQHERIEQLLQQVLDEIKLLRREIEELKSLDGAEHAPAAEHPAGGAIIKS